MSYYLLLTRSITHAQQIASQLEHSGITARYLRAPAGLSTKGCAYAVRIGPRHLQAAMGILRPGGLEPVRIFYAGEDGLYREITAF